MVEIHNKDEKPSYMWVYCPLEDVYYIKNISESKEISPGLLDDIIFRLCGFVDWLVE